MDYFLNFSGSFEKKVAQMMKLMKDSCATIPYGADELSDVQSKNQLLEHYDFTTARMNRRIQATVKYRDKAVKLLADKVSQKEAEELFAYSNGLILRGGYNVVDNNRFITLAAAIWILDQLSLQGCLQKAFPYLPAVDEDELLCPYVVHPQYDQELICSMVKLLLYRNRDSYGGLGLETHESTLVADSLQPGKLRSNFDAVVALLDQDAIALTVEKYKDKVWEFYGLTIPAASLVDKAYERLQQELESLQKAPVAPNKELLQRNNDLRMALHEEARSKRQALKDTCRLQNDNERLRQELADLRGLVFSQQAEMPLQTEESCAVQFPVKTSHRIVSFGGHPNWIRDMKALLPDVAYFSAEVIPNKDIVKNADVVWVQTQYISHAAFYRIASVLGPNTQLRYFGSKSARSCAEQLVTSEKPFVKNN